MRQTLLNTLKRGLTAIIITVQVFFYPAALFAQEAPADVPPAEGEQSQPAEDAPVVTEEPTVSATGPTEPTGPTAPTGPQAPTGASSSTYTQNPDTGMWENDYYIWDPATGQTRPKQAQDYSYNPATGQWDTTEWYYSPEAGKYLPNVVSVSENPFMMAAGSGNTNAISNTGPNSNNQIQNDGTQDATFDLFFDVSISNKIGQLSQSGNATVQGNTLGGDAITGDATAIANLLNMIQSSWGGLGSDDIALFVANLDGDVVGDLYIDPNALANSSGSTNIDVNASSSATIDNYIDVVVASGDALVVDNTTGGDAKSGNATAVVNLLNLINSAIRSDQSFIGLLNINGNLNGDILLPPDLLQSIIAATGPNSNNQITDGSNVNANISTDTDTAINNNIQTDASSGTATVAGNTTGGSAKSGNANTNVVLLNLTGKKVVAKNAMLVFVNVMGSWVGLIFDAPAGTNAVAVTGPGSNNTIDDDSSLSLDFDATTTNLINNDVNVAAHSGDATVSHNTQGGDATTGDASIGVNILNMVDSEFDIDDWFGVLFINVFGNWVGSFGVNTAAGNQPTNVGIVPNNAISNTIASAQSAAPEIFSFVPQNDDSNGAATQGVVAGATDSTTPPPVTQTSGATPALKNIGTASSPSANAGMFWIAGIVTLTGVLMLGGERAMTLIRFRRLA